MICGFELVPTKNIVKGTLVILNIQIVVAVSLATIS